MIKHIVFWTLKESAHGQTKHQNAIQIKDMLENLNGKIDGLLKLEVGIDFSNTDTSYDLALYSEFVSRKALDEYQACALHQAAVPFIGEAKQERIVVDFEI